MKPVDEREKVRRFKFKSSFYGTILTKGRNGSENVSLNVEYKTL